MRVLGISAFYHDSAAAVIEDGHIIAAAQEERFTRKKHDPSFPQNAVAYCLEEGKVELGDVDHVVFYDKPFLKFERLLETYVASAPRGFRSFKMAIPLVAPREVVSKKFTRTRITQNFRKFRRNRQLLFCEHHLSHAASAFLPFAVRRRCRPHHGWCRRMGHDVGGVGRWPSSGNHQEIHFPHSLGLLIRH